MNASVISLLEHKGHRVYQTRPEATVREAVRQMNEQHVGALLVAHGVTPVGIFTERDILVRVVAAGLDPDTTRIANVMSTKLTVISPETTVEEAMTIITNERHRHLPVVGADGRIVGMLSIGDLTRWIVRHHESYIDNLSEYIWGSASVTA